jgi:hypothetical protein
MNGLNREAIARVRTKTRHTEFNNQFEIYKNKKKRNNANIIKKHLRAISFFFFNNSIVTKGN